jgi:N-acetylmuramic acid 6-phosphate etherase
MFEYLITEKSFSGPASLDEMPTAEILSIMNEADSQIAASVKKELPRIGAAVDAIVSKLKQGGRLAYIGAGTSGRLGVLDASECPPTFNVAPDLVRGIIAGGSKALTAAVEAVEDDAEAGAWDLAASGFARSDILVGIAASGRTPYVLGAIAKAKSIGATTCGISCTPDSELSRSVDFPIEPVPGPEVIAGSTRLRAGTATKMVLNMISTAAMIQLGFVYRNLMINVQPTNEKLRDRAARIIQQITGASYEQSALLLAQSGNDVRTAIIMEKKKVDRAEAARLLDAARGRIPEALK